jgi:hypothetical protein
MAAGMASHFLRSHRVRARHATVLHVSDGVSELENAIVVRDDHDGPIGGNHEGAQQLHDGMTGIGVQRPCERIAHDQAQNLAHACGRSAAPATAGGNDSRFRFD